jgi:hypothetical protein
MGVLALQLAARRCGYDIAAGALLAGVTTVTAGLLGTSRGRRLDRAELGLGLRHASVLSGVVLAALTVAVWLRASLLVLVALSVAQGVAIAGVYAGFRAMLWVVSPGGDMARPQVLETMMTELGFMVGPLIVLAVDAAVGITSVFMVMTGLWFLAALALRGVPELHPSPCVTPTALIGLAPVAVLAGVVAGSFTMIEASVPGKVEALGQGPGRAGLFLALLSFGSFLGGLGALARLPGPGDFASTASRFCLAFGALALPATLASSQLALALTLPLGSLLLVPTMGLVASEVDRRVRSTSRTQGFAAVMAIQMVGGGLGSVFAGAMLAARGPSTVVRVAAALLAVVGGAMFVEVRRARAHGAPDLGLGS